MIEVTLRQIKSWIDCDIDDQFLDVKIKGVTIDSRAVQPQMLFIPFKGEHVDGHRFVNKVYKMVLQLHFIKQVKKLVLH